MKARKPVAISVPDWKLKPLLPLAALLLVGCFMGAPRTPHRDRKNLSRQQERDLSLEKPFTGWDDLQAPAVRFRRLQGWTAQGTDGQAVPWTWVNRPNPKEDAAIQFTIPESQSPWSVFFRPPDPILLRDPLDAADLWMLWEPAQPDADPRTIHVSAWLELSSGDVLRLPFTLPAAPGWQLVNRVLDRAFAVPPRFPARLTGFGVEAEPGSAGLLFVSGWTPYLRCRVPLHRTPPPFRKKNNHSAEYRPDAPSPKLVTEPVPTRLPPVDIQSDRFVVPFGSGPIHGDVSLNPNSLSDGFRIRLHTGESLSWSGPRMIGPDRGYPGKLIFWKRLSDGFRLGYSDGLSLDIFQEGSGVALHFSDSGRRISEMAWPWLPAALPAGKAGNPFLSVRAWDGTPAQQGKRYVALAWDPYVSGASTEPEPAPFRGPLTHRVQYLPADDGRRPVLRERFLITAAAAMDRLVPGILPIEAPLLSPGRVLLVEETTDPTHDFPRLGLDPPVRISKSAAFSESPFDLHPLATGWSRDDVARKTDGAWQSGSEPGSARMKALVLFSNWRRQALAAEPAPSALLIPAPRQALREWTDYDSRMNGAGSYLASILSAVSALRVTPPRRLPLVMEEDAGWMFAPWASALLRSDIQGLNLRDDLISEDRFPPAFATPFLPIGAGSFIAWKETHPKSDPARLLDRFLAVQIAAGGAGRLPEPEAVPPSGLVLSARALQTLHARSLGRAPLWRGADQDGRIVDAELIPRDRLRRDRLYRRISDEVEAWINLSDTEDWTITVGHDHWVLPPMGWAVIGPEFRNLSVSQNGTRIHWVEDNHTVYFSSSDPAMVFQGFQAHDGVLVRRGTATLLGSIVEVYDYSKSGRVRIRGDEWTGWLSRAWECHSEDGEILGPARLLSDGESILLQGPPGTLLYRLPKDPPQGGQAP